MYHHDAGHAGDARGRHDVADVIELEIIVEGLVIRVGRTGQE
jgi:hypothetical protein